MVDIVIGCVILLSALVILGYGFAFYYKDKSEDKLGFSALATVILALFSLFFLKTCDNGYLVSWPDKYEGIKRPMKYANEHGDGGVILVPPATQPVEK